MARRRARAPAKGGQLRIIAGAWRGRRLGFPESPGLRPTPDRVRETLFNWLQGVIEGSRCLDLYAGSGALGLEAASRGAGAVQLVEADAGVCRALRENIALLEASQVSLAQQDAGAFLEHADQAFDIVFLDPPFRQGMLAGVIDVLHERSLVKPGGYVYIEAEAELGEPVLPEGWRLERARQAGDVGYYLVRV